MFQFRRTCFDWNPYGWGRHPRGRFQAPERYQQRSLLPRLQCKTCRSQTLCSTRTQPIGPKTQSGFRVVSSRQGEDRTRIDAQTDVLREPLGGFGKSMEEVIHRIVDLVVELIDIRRIEESEKQSAVITQGLPVMHQGERPGASQPRVGHRLSAR